MNMYAVLDTKRKAIVYIGQVDECHRYIKNNDLQNHEVWNITDIEYIPKTRYLSVLE